MNAIIKILVQNFTHFGGFYWSFLTILGVKKVVFWTFSKLFGSCLGSVQVLVQDFTATKVDPRAVYSPLGSRGSPTKLRLRFRRTLYQFQNFTTPVRPMKKKNFYCAVVVGRIYHSKYFCVKMSCIFFSFFFKSFKLLGGTILIFFSSPTSQKQSSQVDNGPKNRHFLARLTFEFCPFWGSKKSISVSFLEKSGFFFLNVFIYQGGRF